MGLKLANKNTSTANQNYVYNRIYLGIYHATTSFYNIIIV